MNADMSDTSWSLCRRARAARPSGVSPSACIAASRSRAASSVNTGGGCVSGTRMRRCGGASSRKPEGCVRFTPSGARKETPVTGSSGSSAARPSSSPPSDAVTNPSASSDTARPKTPKTPFSSEETRAGSAVAPSSATKSTSSSGDFARGVSDERKPRVKKVVVAVASSPSRRPPAEGFRRAVARASRSRRSRAASERSYASTEPAFRRRIHALMS